MAYNKLDVLLEQAQRQLADLLHVLAGGRRSEEEQSGEGSAGTGRTGRPGLAAAPDQGDLSEPGAGSPTDRGPLGPATSPLGESSLDISRPDLSGARSTAEAMERCLEPLVGGEGTAVLSDARGLLLAGVGPEEAQENLAAVGALALQMALRSAEFLDGFEPHSLVVGGQRGEAIGATLFEVEGEHLVLLLSGPARLHRRIRIQQVLEWIQPLVQGATIPPAER